jgi:hypothetical protein
MREAGKRHTDSLQIDVGFQIKARPLADGLPLKIEGSTERCDKGRGAWCAE